MSDDTTTAPEPVAVDPAPTMTAPAVHGSELWEGAQALVSLPDSVGKLNTKQEYWDTLNKLGFRMKDQQESTTGPARYDAPAWSQPAKPIKPRKTPPIFRDEAHVICAAWSVLLRQRIREALYCLTCFARKAPDGCSARLESRSLRIQCRCGKQEYRPPTGATDLPTGLSNTTYTLNDTAPMVIETAGGRWELSTRVLAREEAGALYAYFRFLGKHKLQARWFCDYCWDHVNLGEAHAMAVDIDESHIVAACQCRALYHQTTTN